MLHLRTVAVLIVEPLNDVTDGTGDEFNHLPGRKQNQETFWFNPQA